MVELNPGFAAAEINGELFEGVGWIIGMDAHGT